MILRQTEDREVQKKIEEMKKVMKKEGCLPLKTVETRCVLFFPNFWYVSFLCICRWSTKIYSMESVLKLQDIIQLAVPEPPSPQDWQLLKKVVERLRPIADATQEIEADNATVDTVNRCTKMLT